MAEQLQRATHTMNILFYTPIVILAIIACHPAQAQPTVADQCGGSPGDPPTFLFAPGSTTPIVDGPPASRWLERWRQRIRPDITLVLLTGTADTTEAGYTPDLALRRAEAVRLTLAATGIKTDAIWVRGRSVSPTTPIEHMAILARNVTIDDPLRAAACRADTDAQRFAWYETHCANSKTALNTDAPACKLTADKLSRRKP